jgi:[ribosomal protein S18]-alanine N-acetyltransferase
MTVRDSTVTIERLRWWHINAVLAIEADLFGDERWTAGMFWNELANEHHYVAAFGTGAGAGELVGYGGVALSPPDEAWINNIAVRADWQRRGIGAAMLDALLAYTRSHGARHVLLEVAADNASAQKLYDAYGFEVIGVRRGYYQPSNTDALVMRRSEL